MPMLAPVKPIHVTLLGDSTIDNRIWVDGLKKNWLFTRLGISHNTPEQRIQKYKHGIFKPELSVVENLRIQLPEQYQIHDGTNDGFTSENVLLGASRSKVFGSGTFSMFPDEWFVPLTAHKADIQHSDHIVISVGGNDIREFLQSTFRLPEEERQAYIKSAFPQVLQRLTQNYLLIIGRVRELNPHARLVIMTQYYPSASQNTYNIYKFMSEVGKALDVGGKDHHPMNVIQHLVAETFRGVINNVKDDNVVIADVTSSLNPFDNNNHTSQIEPSGLGGQKIAKMLHHLLTAPVAPGQIYRFNPRFFDKGHATAVINEPITDSWTPLHPRAIDKAEQRHTALMHPDTNYSFTLKALIGLSIAALAITLLWLSLPTLLAIGGTVAVCATAGYAAYRLFKPSTKMEKNEELSIEGAPATPAL